MNDHPAIIFTAAMIFMVGLFSRLSDRSPVTAAMSLVAVGTFVGPAGAIGRENEGQAPRRDQP